MFRDALKTLAKRIIPPPVRLWMRITRVRLTEVPPYRCVRFGSFRRTTPIHAGFDVSRGSYIDRYYIESFLQENSAAIKGRTLELSDNEYTLRFGAGKVTRSDVLDVRPGHPSATIIADLADADVIPSDSFDCVILTQTLNFIYDVRGAIRNVYRILKPGGCVLVSASGIAQIAPREMEYCGDYWRFTRLSLRLLFEEVFPPACVKVESRGNVLAAVGFLHGLAAEELKTEELDYHDPVFEVVVLLKAIKSAR